MIPIKKISGLGTAELDRLFNRFGTDFSDIMINRVVPIVNDVRARGDRAVLDYTEKFDSVRPASVLAPEEEIEAGYRATPDKVIDAFMEARNNIEEFHSRQRRDDIRYTRDDGTRLGVLYQPIRSAAIYVPGGKASYPSSVLMGVIPAQIAGCDEITVITPPGPNGRVPDAICAVCRILGVTRIVRAGGAQAIAAAGFGTETVPGADIIVGPGNIFVTAAKTYLFSLGVIQIDSMAGPSEVLIIADEKAPPRWVAYDLLSQAEHEEMAIALLVTPSEDLALKVRDEIEKDLTAGGGRYAIKKTSIAQSGLILLADSLDQAIDFSNRYGPEHMEFMVQNATDYLDRIRNVGSLFLGYHAPVAVGDYYSGTNHILPTGGAARFSSGTSVETFLRRTTFQWLPEGALEKARGPVGVMSKIEGFDDKHGGSIEVRFEKTETSQQGGR
jgi:histidinol dehydrogenase